MHGVQVAFERGKDFMKSFFEIIVLQATDGKLS